VLGKHICHLDCPTTHQMVHVYGTYIPVPYYQLLSYADRELTVAISSTLALGLPKTCSTGPRYGTGVSPAKRFDLHPNTMESARHGRKDSRIRNSQCFHQLTPHLDVPELLVSTHQLNLTPKKEDKHTSSSIVSQGQLPTSFRILLPRQLENPSSSVDRDRDESARLGWSPWIGHICGMWSEV